MNKIRLRLATFLVWIGSRIAPRSMRPVFAAYGMMLAKFPEQIAMGRTWGVVTGPWAADPKDRETAIAMQACGMSAMNNWRQKYHG